MSQEQNSEQKLLPDAMKRRLHRRLRRRSILIAVTGILVGGIILAVLGFFAVKVLFTVESLQCESTEFYDSGEILEVSGIKEGDSMFLIREEQVKKALLKKFPMLCDVTIRKEYPNTLIILPEEEKPLFFFIADIPENEYVVVSESLKVLEMFPDEESMNELFPTLYYLEMPELSYAVSGKKLVFSSAGDADYLPGFINLLDASDLSGEIVKIDVSSRFNIRVYCQREQESYIILFGNKKELSEKLAFAKGIKEKLPADFVGVISVEDPRKGYADPEDA
ncbi:MAG: FtsQ-type POTRA domain-containing protein [Clostridia bacterium]|nr:FtsQ-type POTRA domain-containing protein [Clostridia bacterium]